MILAVDIGNTNINFAVFNGDVIEHFFRVRISDFLLKRCEVKDFCGQIDFECINRVVTSSVNPGIESIFCSWLNDSYGIVSVKIGEDLQPDILLQVDNPGNVGMDRVLNSVAAYKLEKKSVIIVDVGTATTIDVVSGGGVYLGGVIAPGVKMCSDALNLKTAQLPLVKVKKTDRVLGKNTEDSIISGIYWGCLGSITFIIEKLFDELKCKPSVIATGGDADLICDSKYISRVVPYLTLEGINIVFTDNVDMHRSQFQ